ncbi:MAG: GNAT family N-acetyltransferase, partial [Planctomycetota bacterium]
DVPESAGMDLLRTVIRRQRWRAPTLALMNVPAESWTGRVIQAYGTRQEGETAELTESASFTVRLPRSIDEYVSGLSQRARRDFGYDRRRLAKEHVVEFRVHEGIEGIDEVIDQIEAIDIARWGGESMYRRPAQRAFERSLIKALAARRLLLAFLLYVDGKPATFAWGGLVRGIVEVARIAYDPALLPKLSIGKVTNFYAIEECIRRGYTEFDLARGGEAYKAWLGAVPEKLLTIQIHRSPMDRLAQRLGRQIGAAVRKRQWVRDLYRRHFSR